MKKRLVSLDHNLEASLLLRPSLHPTSRIILTSDMTSHIATTPHIPGQRWEETSISIQSIIYKYFYVGWKIEAHFLDSESNNCWFNSWYNGLDKLDSRFWKY
jgi:hypothetical protein